MGKLMIFDHVGVVVKTLSDGRRGFETILQICRWSDEFADPLNGVKVQFGCDASGMCYELLEPLGINSPVQAALRQRRAILNHVAYRVADLETAAAHLGRSGCVPTADPKPAIAYQGKRIQFF